MSSKNSVFGVVGTMLGLIALYLVLEHGNSASGIIGAAGGTTSQIFKTLQGR